MGKNNLSWQSACAILFSASILLAQTGAQDGVGFKGGAETAISGADTSGNIPLPDFVALSECDTKYLGLYTGGLYPGCSNTVPSMHASIASALAAEITPLDTTGSPSSTGTCSSGGSCIVVLGIGNSIANRLYGALAGIATPGPHVLIDNSGYGSRGASTWFPSTPGVTPDACRSPAGVLCPGAPVNLPANQSGWDSVCTDLTNGSHNCNQVEVLMIEDTNTQEADTFENGTFGSKVRSAIYKSGIETVVSASLASHASTSQSVTVWGVLPSGFNCVNCPVRGVSPNAGTISFAQPGSPSGKYASGGVIAAGNGLPISSISLSEGTETVTALGSPNTGLGVYSGFATLMSVGSSVTVTGSTEACNVQNATVTGVNPSENTVTFTNGSGSASCSGGTIFGTAEWAGGPQWVPVIKQMLKPLSMDSVSAHNNDFAYTQTYNLIWEFGQVLRSARQVLPNLKLCIFTSRNYAGYCVSSDCDDSEPFAYEAGFAWQALVEAQIAEERGLGMNHLAGDLCPPSASCAEGVTGSAPLLLWANQQGSTIYDAYGWSNGPNPTAESSHEWCQGQSGPACDNISTGSPNRDDYQASSNLIHCVQDVVGAGCDMWATYLNAYLMNGDYTKGWWGD